MVPTFEVLSRVVQLPVEERQKELEFIEQHTDTLMFETESRAYQNALATRTTARFAGRSNSTFDGETEGVKSTQRVRIECAKAV